jgi:hypothetical protein
MLIIIIWNLFSSPSWSTIGAGIVFNMNHQTQYLVPENKSIFHKFFFNFLIQKLQPYFTGSRDNYNVVRGVPQVLRV